MAKSNGILNIEGTVENLTFFKKDGKSFVRKKGGIPKERILNDPNFVRTRENISEFTHSANAGKMLRTAIGSMVFKAKDNKLSSRLMQAMSKVKNADSASARGQRNVALGIATLEGKAHLKGFDFNSGAPLKSVLFSNFSLNTGTGEVKFTNLLPAEQLQFPQGATHFSLQSAVLLLDFETEASETSHSPVTNLPINLAASSPILTPGAVPSGSGQLFFLLLISFYQEVNGVQYSLKNEDYNVLHILDVV